MIDIEQLADRGQCFDKYYLLLRPINTEGGTADVWLALDIRTVKDKKILKEALALEEDYLATKGLLVAIKVYRPKNALDIEGEAKFMDEFTIVYNCRHSNLITPTSFSIFEETPYLVLPYCKKGSSELLIGSFTDDDNLWKYILDVSSGLAYLHHCHPPIIHQDIKPANVLIDDFGNYAITDFGISEKYDNQDKDNDEYEDRSGTSAYMSPERFDTESEPSEASDIWAFGATLYELITGNVPFGEDGGSTQVSDKVTLQYPKSISSDIQRLINECLSKDPDKRPSAEDIIKSSRRKQYPLKGRPILKKIVISLCLVVAIVSVLVFLQGNNTQKKTDPELLDNNKGQVIEASDDVLFDEALTYIKCNTKDSIENGIKKLEKLAEKGYIPALYQLGYTYGWIPETESKRRKDILGIELGNPKGDSLEKGKGDYMPKSDEVNRKAMVYFERIVINNDGNYDDLVMMSLYRLGLYYILEKNNAKAKEYMEKAKKIADKLDSNYAESCQQVLDNLM